MIFYIFFKMYFLELPEKFNIVYVLDVSTFTKSRDKMTKIVEREMKYIDDHIYIFRSLQDVNLKIISYGNGVKNDFDVSSNLLQQKIDISSLIGQTTSLGAALRDVDASFSDGSLSSNTPTLLVIFQANELSAGQARRASTVIDDLRSKTSIKTLWVKIDSGDDVDLGLRDVIAPTDTMESVSSAGTLYQVLPVSSELLSSFIGMIFK